MNKKTLLSIIIPVYNVQDYLKDCYYSIYSEKLSNDIEIILVDDGSTDKSGEICDSFLKNRKTLVFHKKNGGLGSARNYGIRKSHGKYITFVDSDDIIYKESLIEVINYLKSKDTDLLFLNISKFYPDGKIKDIGENIKQEKIHNKNMIDIINHLTSREKFPASACGKIYKKEFLFDENIFFPNDKRISEDMGFSFECIYRAKEIDKLDIPFYFYRKERENSITSNIRIDNFLGLKQFIVETSERYSNKLNNKKTKSMFSYIAYEYCILLWQLNFLKKEEKEKALDFLKEYKWVLRYGRSKRTKIIRFLSIFFGLKCTSKILLMLRGRRK